MLVVWRAAAKVVTSAALAVERIESIRVPIGPSHDLASPGGAAAITEEAKTIEPMEPNDLPIVVLPLELSDDSAANLIEFLHALTEALERHYAGELLRREHQRFPQSPLPHPSDPVSDDGPTVLTVNPYNPIVARSAIIRSSQPN